MTSEDDVRSIALSLPETEERSSYGTPGFRVKDRLFARIREAGVLLVRVADEGEKDFLLRADPGKFFTIAHYDGHASVLVRLAAIDRVTSSPSCSRTPGASAPRSASRRPSTPAPPSRPTSCWLTASSARGCRSRCSAAARSTAR